MADEVKRIEIFSNFSGKIVQNYSVLFEFFDDNSLALRSIPSPQKIVQRRELGFDLFFCELTVRLCDQLPVRADILNSLAHNSHGHAADIHLMLTAACTIVAL